MHLGPDLLRTTRNGATVQLPVPILIDLRPPSWSKRFSEWSGHKVLISAVGAVICLYWAMRRSRWSSCGLQEHAYLPTMGLLPTCLFQICIRERVLIKICKSGPNKPYRFIPKHTSISSPLSASQYTLILSCPRGAKTKKACRAVPQSPCLYFGETNAYLIWLRLRRSALRPVGTIWND